MCSTATRMTHEDNTQHVEPWMMFRGSQDLRCRFTQHVLRVPACSTGTRTVVSNNPYCSANNAHTTAVLHVLQLAARVHVSRSSQARSFTLKHAQSLSSTLKHVQVRGHGRFLNHFTTDVCL